MIKILIVDDEMPICDLIDRNLSAAGYSCVAVQDGLSAIDEIEKNTFDLVLLDIMLPGADGYDVMEYIRPYKVPVIFISAKHEVKDRVRGLKLGADDYLIKPFDVTELLARVEAVLRRYNKTDKIITLGDVEIDVDARRVTRGGSPIPLTSKEFDLMLLFVENRNIALFRENLYERVWDDEYLANSRTLCSGSGRSWDGRRIWWRCTRLGIDWSCKIGGKDEIFPEAIAVDHDYHSAYAGAQWFLLCKLCVQDFS